MIEDFILEADRREGATDYFSRRNHFPSISDSTERQTEIRSVQESQPHIQAR